MQCIVCELPRADQVKRVARGDLSPQRALNYDAYMITIRADVAAGKAGDIACMELDRNGKNWSSTVRYDSIMSLRVSGPEIFLVSIYDMDADLSNRVTHGYLPDVLRFPLQGHLCKYATDMPSGRALRATTGNAFAVPMMARAVIPLATLAVQSGVCATVRKRPKTESELQCMARGRELKKRRFDFG